MSRKQVITKYQLLSAVDSATDPVSQSTDVQQVDFVTYEFLLAGTVNAFLEVEYCNDNRISDASVFRPLDFGQTLPLIGATDTSGIVHIENRGFKFLRLSISNNGGTGTISAWISAASRGA